MDDSKNEKEERGITKDNSKGMNTKEAISHIEAAIDCRAFIEIKLEHYATYRKAMLEIIEMLKRGEMNKKIIDKMRKEKFDVWVSLPGSFTNLADFVDDIEKEVIK